MSGVLSSLGITAAPPDPNLLKNQKEVADQLAAVKKDLEGSLGAIDLATKTATLLGVSDTYMDGLKGLRAKATDLLNQTTMPPDQLDKKRAELDAELMKVQKKQEESIDQQRLEEAKVARDQIEARVKEIEADTTTSKPLLRKYQDLATSAREYYDALKITIEKAAAAAKTGGKEGFQTAPAAPATANFVVTPADLLEQLNQLNIQKEAEEDKTFDPQRATNRFLRSFRRSITALAILLLAITGGAIVSNAFAAESFIGLRAFYFVYGALAFPLSLLYGCVRPPPIYAYIFPAVDSPTGVTGVFSYSMRRAQGGAAPVLEATAPAAAAAGAAPPPLKGGGASGPTAATAAPAPITFRIPALVMTTIGGLLAAFYRLDQYIVKGG